MYYGVSYYPEQKSTEELCHDIKLLKESGINTVRMGEFAWCRMEPIESGFDFAWLDEVVEELGTAGIKTVICTPTACPPAWLIEKYPDILYMDNRRVRRPFGGRRHYCYNNEVYHSYCKRIAKELGKHFGRNPYVMGFQIDNELAQEGTGRCACPICENKFREYLKTKYRTIEEWNRRSGAVFWSQEYTHFDQIEIPVNTIETASQNLIIDHPENPTLRLEFERFASDSQIEFQNVQTFELRKHTDYPITTNTTGLATNSIDYYKSTDKLDNYAFDYYPILRNRKIPSFPYAFARGVKSSTPFWILEFTSGGGHAMRGSGRRQPSPGALKLSTIQSMVHGGEMMLHFQFRSFPAGAEQLNYAIVDLDGKPRRRYYEMKDTARELKALEPYLKAEFDNDVAICMDYDALWALKIKPINQNEFDYLRFCEKFYNSLSEMGVNAEVISFDADFTKYRLVIIPCGVIMSDEVKIKSKNYVKQGGNVFSTFLTGIKNVDNIGCVKELPAELDDLFGITVEEWEAVFDDTQSEICLTLDEGEKIKCYDSTWSELLDGPAEGIGVYTEGFKSGYKTVTRNSYGLGHAYYMGTELPDEAMKKLFDTIFQELNIVRSPITSDSSMVEVVKKKLNGEELYFVFNFSAYTTEMLLTEKLMNCQTSLSTSQIILEANSYCILKRL